MKADLMTNAANREFDVIIVGAGPAGLCAAMYAGRGLLHALTIERGAPGGELLNTELIEDYIGFDSILGRDLAKKMADHAAKFGARLVTDTVERIRKGTDGWFEVETAKGERYRSRAVILTAGGTPVKLGIPGEKEYAGRGVSYCAVCDGAFFKGERLAVIGGGDAAVEEADYLTRYASRVYLIHRRDEFRASKIIQERTFANPKIEVIRNTVVPEIVGDERGVKHAVLQNTVTGEQTNLEVGGVFVFIGFTPNTQLVDGHVDHDAGGYFITDHRMMTSMPGLFAAGDVRSQLTRQITTAVGDATTAAIAVEKYVTAMREQERAQVETSRAVP
ncbi:MAG: thioredoxin-disulfide reductase [Gemmatimonadales bacterium]